MARSAQKAAKNAQNRPKNDGSGWMRAMARLDGWENIVTGQGIASRDKRMGALFRPGSKIDKYTLEQMYTFDDVVARAVDIIPQEMLREGVSILEDTDGALMAALDGLEWRKKIREALAWSRLKGGALVVIGADDGKSLSAPLDLKSVRAVNYLNVYDAYEARPFAYYNDPFKPKFRDVAIYELWPSGTPLAQNTLIGAKVHESRCLRFDGMLVPRELRNEYDGWGPTLVDRLYPVIRDFAAAFGSMGLLLTEFVQNVYKIKGLAEALQADEEDLVRQRLSTLDLTRSVFRAIPIDAELEEFERTAPTAVSGLSDLLDRMALRLSMALGVPMTLLMGQSPAGLNATGESDHANFYNTIKAMQIEQLQAPLSRLFTLVAKANSIPNVVKKKTVAFDFRSLWQPSDLEIAQTHEAQAKADEMYVKNGILSPFEVALSRFRGGRYSLDTRLEEESSSSRTKKTLDPTAPPPKNDTSGSVAPKKPAG
jgi:phage-related protein (TIGR01555 family)